MDNEQLNTKSPATPIGQKWHLMNALLGCVIMLISLGIIVLIQFIALGPNPYGYGVTRALINLIGVIPFFGSYYVISLRAAKKTAKQG